MKLHWPRPWLLTLVLQGLVATAWAQVDEATIRAHALILLKTHFPDAEWKPRGGGGFVFSYKTREFVLYSGDKTGAWQPPSTETGPDSGGFMVEFVVNPEPWGGALVIPFADTEDRYVFQDSLVVRESKDGRSHIWASIKNPRYKDHGELRDRLLLLFNAFGEDVLPKQLTVP
jgi:hypothetical protein